MAIKSRPPQRTDRPCNSQQYIARGELMHDEFLPEAHGVYWTWQPISQAAVRVQMALTSLVMRWRLTLRLVPSVWANRLTRSSSTIQRASSRRASR